MTPHRLERIRLGLLLSRAAVAFGVVGRLLPHRAAGGGRRHGGPGLSRRRRPVRVAARRRTGRARGHGPRRDRAARPGTLRDRPSPSVLGPAALAERAPLLRTAHLHRGRCRRAPLETRKAHRCRRRHRPVSGLPASGVRGRPLSGRVEADRDQHPLGDLSPPPARAGAEAVGCPVRSPLPHRRSLPSRLGIRPVLVGHGLLRVRDRASWPTPHGLDHRRRIGLCCPQLVQVGTQRGRAGQRGRAALVGAARVSARRLQPRSFGSAIWACRR